MARRALGPAALQVFIREGDWRETRGQGLRETRGQGLIKSLVAAPGHVGQPSLLSHLDAHLSNGLTPILDYSLLYFALDFYPNVNATQMQRK